MMGSTLREIRRRIEDLSTPTGDFVVRCARTGERPVPLFRRRFPDRATATEAARLGEEYRAELRRYDPRVPWYDLVATEDADFAERDGEPLVDPQPTPDDRQNALAEYCHEVAAAVFETLSTGPYRRVERAVMDTYLRCAEAVTDPDDLCLALLESVARALDEHLDDAAQADVLREAAARLDRGVGEPAVGSGHSADLARDSTHESPLTGVFETLRRVALVEGYRVRRVRPSPRERTSERADEAERRWTVSLHGYALAPADDRLPTLPVVVGLLRTLPNDATVTEARRTADGWALTVIVGSTRPTGRVRIRPT
ncbi:DUF7551 domain-containing protein [Halomarina pelagica]|uniref:DUF7551 domain-containing protein n=1 Tax=Halomarina pelagica TaxID=2961599 RepID=UPI0020C48746|nr:hypothetical protein [Halomarina sp. BND7]